MSEELQEYNTKLNYLKMRLRSEKHILTDHIASLIKENERVHTTFQGEFSTKLDNLTIAIEKLSESINKLKEDFEKDIEDLKQKLN